MIDTINDILTEAERGNEKLSQVMEKLYAAARPGAVYSEPVTSGSYTVITASEVMVGGGFGSGIGLGPAMNATVKQTDGQLPEEPRQQSGGGGLGGGGGSSGRPIAVIIIGPNGVTVKPVVDATKVALAFATVLGAMLVTLGKMRRVGRKVSR
ncbi:MAG TPA: hypothetical protein VJ761_24615 [Ktedonobacteraceae bacterium]|nr:hypothetical protein [Ktedonobacteraceae bacterium]